MTLPAKAENVAVVRHALAGLAEEIGMDEAGVADLKTVVTEACMNVVVHAYEGSEQGPVEVRAWPEREGLTITVRDFGSGIRPLADVERRSLRLGLPLIAALTRSLQISGEPGQGTEVRALIPFSSNGAAPPAGDVPELADETRIKLPAGDLLAPILSRVISMFATRADLSVDDLSDAVLISDAISAGGRDGFPDGTARIVVSEARGSFEVRVGPLAEGGGQRLIDGMRIPSLDASVATLADEVRVEEIDSGELLTIRIANRDAAP